MLNSLNFNHLYYFNVIAECQTLSKASKVLGVSQPTLSQQLKQLEDDLGNSLFDRSSRSLKLNEHGEYIFEYTKKIFSQAEEMMSGFSYRQKVSGLKKFNVGITSSLSRSYTAKFLQPLYRDPEIGVTIIEGELHILIEKLYRKSIDFIITDTPSSILITEDICKFDIMKPNHVYVCGKDYDRASYKDPSSLSEKNYFKYTSANQLQRDVDKFFYKNNINPKVIGESDNINIMIAATEQNNCFCIVPTIAVEKALRDKYLFKLGDFIQSDSTICSLYLKDHSNDDIVNMVEKIKNSTT